MQIWHKTRAYMIGESLRCWGAAARQMRVERQTVAAGQRWQRRVVTSALRFWRQRVAWWAHPSVLNRYVCVCVCVCVCMLGVCVRGIHVYTHTHTHTHTHIIVNPLPRVSTCMMCVMCLCHGARDSGKVAHCRVHTYT
jgi:hypothetical protein